MPKTLTPTTPADYAAAAIRAARTKLVELLDRGVSEDDLAAVAADVFLAGVIADRGEYAAAHERAERALAAATLIADRL